MMLEYITEALKNKSDEELLEYFIYPVWVFIDTNIHNVSLEAPWDYNNNIRITKAPSCIHQLQPSDDTSFGATLLMYMTTLTDANTFFRTKDDALNEVAHILSTMYFKNLNDEESTNTMQKKKNNTEDNTQTSTSIPEISW